MCNVYVFENMLYTLVELSMDEAIDMDEHNFKASDIFGTISNRILRENWLMSSLISWRPPQTYLGTFIIDYSLILVLKHVPVLGLDLDDND